MRIQLVALLLIITFVNVSASVNAQNVTLKTNSAPLKSVFEEIKKQTGYFFFYEDNILMQSKKVSVNLTNATLTEALEACIKGQRLEYTINDKTIVIKKAQRNLIERVIDSFKAIDVSGQVVDQNNEPLPGATIKAAGSKKETVTDGNGKFSLQDIEENEILEISFLGYITQEVQARATMTITMQPSMEALKDVVVNAGYYSVTNRERTGSISKVDAKIISQQPIGNPLAAVIGRMSGVNIEQQTGLNGGGFRIEIRGQNSLRNTAADNGNRPLYLINGVAYPSTSLTGSLGVIGISGQASPLNAINPNDIESIEILKDADATAIYGSRGANGVILITTKKAKAGKATYELGIQQGFSTVSNKIELLNTAQYIAMREEAFKNDGVTPGPTQYDVNGTWDRNRYTDWQQALVGGTANTTTLSGALSGGNEFTRFSFFGNYNRQTTVFPVDFANHRVSGSISVSHASENRKFTAEFSTLYAIDANNLPKLDLSQYLTLSPNAPALYNANGELNWALNSSGAATWVNPLASTKQPYNSKAGNILTSALLSYEIIPGLSLKANAGYNSTKFRESLLQPIASLAPSGSATGSNTIMLNSIDTWNIEPQVSFQHKFSNGILNVLVGSTFQATTQNAESIYGIGYTSDTLLESISAAPTRVAVNSSSLYKYAAAFARVNYNHKGTYILNLTGRRDGSSRFGPNKQFANFGAVGAAWIFSNYAFISKALPVLSFGKVRTSYGITGNDQIPDYGYLEIYSALNPYVDGSALFPAQIGNPDYSWEKNKKFEVALELGFAKDRFFLSGSWYQNRSSNQLVGYKLPDITGFGSIQYNLPAMVENTGFEFEANGKLLQGSKFSWNAMANLTIPRNKLVSYPGIEGSSYANTYTVGESLYKQRKYIYLGVDPATGNYAYQDLNSNGLLDAGDRTATRQAFTSSWFGGIQNSIRYGNVTLDVFVQAVNKVGVSPYNNGSASLPGALSNQPIEVLDRWQKPGDQTKFGKYSQSFVAGGVGASFNQLANSDNYEDASFIRLKNVAISYDVPHAIASKLKLHAVKVYLQGQNLWTITKYPGDPEVGSLRAMPTLRTFTAGISVGL